MKATISAAFAAAVLASSVALAQAPGAPASKDTAGTDTQFLAVQPAGQSSARVLLGHPVVNKANEPIGDLNDVLFDKYGRLTTAVIGVGGFLGIGEKSVAVPFDMLSFSLDTDGKRMVTAPLTKEALQLAPAYQPVEKTSYMRARDQAVEMGRKAMDTASELSDKAAKKLEEWMGEPKKE